MLSRRQQSFHRASFHTPEGPLAYVGVLQFTLPSHTNTALHLESLGELEKTKSVIRVSVRMQRTSVGVVVRRY